MKKYIYCINCEFYYKKSNVFRDDGMTPGYGEQDYFYEEKEYCEYKESWIYQTYGKDLYNQIKIKNHQKYVICPLEKDIK